MIGRLKGSYERLQTTRVWRVVADAIGHFVADDGMALSSHIALSGLISLFPFLIFLTALAGWFGSQDLAQQIAEAALETLPGPVANTIAIEVDKIVALSRPGLLTVSVLIALWIASNGVEAVRTGLNRAYRLGDRRNFVFLRLQSLFFVFIGAVSLLSLASLVLFAPLAWETAIKYYPLLADLKVSFTVIRFGSAGLVLVLALYAAHRFLPARPLRLIAILPGLFLTLFLWLLFSSLFGTYLAKFANYSATYAGLAGIMATLIFLNLTAAILILGAELNAAIARVSSEKRAEQSRQLFEDATGETAKTSVLLDND